MNPAQMIQQIQKSVTVIYRKVVTSIAFIPGLISMAMLLLSLVMIEFDFSSTGKNIKSGFSWLTLKDADTARMICSTIAGGILSLTVFSFSMVMILLSQAASQMSNRILSKLISNRFQQVVLGFYIGTILYALFLLSTIRDIDSGVHVPALSAYLLIALTLVDIFLFIYFLHYVTQSVKFDTIIYEVFKDTKKALKQSCMLTNVESTYNDNPTGTAVKAYKSGTFVGFDESMMIALCEKHDTHVYINHPVRTYMIEGASVMLYVEGSKPISNEFLEQLPTIIDIGRRYEINTSYFYGFKQLTEIGIKALSPGINDPGTCILSLQALAELFAYRLTHSPPNYLKDKKGNIRVRMAEKPFDEVFNQYMLPIWDYGKNDRLVQQEMVHLLTQLQSLGNSLAVSELLAKSRTRLASISVDDSMDKS